MFKDQYQIFKIVQYIKLFYTLISSTAQTSFLSIGMQNLKGSDGNLRFNKTNVVTGLNIGSLLPERNVHLIPRSSQCFLMIYNMVCSTYI